MPIVNFLSKCGLSKRSTTVLFLFIIITICYMIRVDLNITIISMVNNTEPSFNVYSKENTSYICAKENEISLENSHKMLSTGIYHWNRPIQGYILGAFFWGYVVTQIPGGLLSLHFGPKWLGLILLAGCSLLDLCLPMAASVGPAVLIALRVAQGLFQGMLFPIVGCLIGRWIPPEERARATAFSLAGCQIGTILGQVFAGLLSQPHPLASDGDDTETPVSNWPYVHYLFGAVGLVFTILWSWMVYDSPEKHPNISSKELRYLQDRLNSTRSSVMEKNSVNENNGADERDIFFGESRKIVANALIEVHPDSGVQSKSSENNLKPCKTSNPGFRDVPWFQLFRSGPVWSLVICNITTNWCWYTLITCMPTYMSRVLGFSMTQNGLLSSLPYLAQCLFSQLVAFLSDTAISRRWLSTTWVRKLNNTIALGGLGTGLLSVGLIGCNRVGVVSILVTSMGILGAASSGFSTNPIDLAPNYAGVIISLANTVGTLPGILGPLFVGYMTKNSSSLENWFVVFGVSAGMAWFGAIFNLFTTKGSVQPWARSGRTIAGG